MDDQPDNLHLLSQIMVRQNYKVRKAINGSTALMGVKTLIRDLILLDINMPGLNGYQDCQKLKSDVAPFNKQRVSRMYYMRASPLSACSDRQTKQIPIIFLSASDDVKDKVKALETGFGD